MSPVVLIQCVWVCVCVDCQVGCQVWPPGLLFELLILPITVYGVLGWDVYLGVRRQWFGVRSLLPPSRFLRTDLLWSPCLQSQCLYPLALFQFVISLLPGDPFCVHLWLMGCVSHPLYPRILSSIILTGFLWDLLMILALESGLPEIWEPQSISL